MNTKEAVKNDKFYTGRNDRVFKTIFVNDNDFHLMEALLSECLDTDVKVIKYLYPEIAIENVSVKEKKLDVLVEIEGRNVIVELNTEGAGIRLRNFNYFTSYYSSRVLRGEEYSNNKTEYILIDLSYNLHENSPIRREYYVTDENGFKYVENFKIIEFNMDKITKICYDEFERGEREQYRYLMMLDLDENKLNKISKKDDIVKEYMDKLVELNNDETFRYIISAEEDARLTRKLLQDYAKEEGKAEGIKEGRAEGRDERNIEIAKELLKNNVAIDIIISSTGLSLEEVEKLK